MGFSPDPSIRRRYFFFGLAWVFFAIGVAGAILPLLPATPFMLLSLWAFSRSSRRFHSWLYNHRWFGPSLQNWERGRVIPWSVRLTAYGWMLGALVVSSFVADVHWSVPVALGCLSLAGIAFLSRFPTKPQNAVRARQSESSGEKPAT